MADAGTSQAIGFLPLYKQVRAALVKRLEDQTWPPGHALPSEMELAAEIGVSQGTVRKALDEMAAERLLVRKQGRGTYVAEHDDARILFQFFKLSADSGERVFPDSRILSVQTGVADEAEAQALQMSRRARVIRIRRVRLVADTPLLVERIILPHKLFAGIENGDIPNNLYQLYAARYGITVARASEKLKAIAINAEEAPLLAIAVRTPVLCVDRIALGLRGEAVEWRVSHCRTDHFHYASDLT
ncbi:MAG: GntR family transcriptional regulator [Beijerinckiaceae bacterium]